MAKSRGRGRGRREIQSKINILPLMDLLLVLLLIFMATEQISTQSVEVNLPDTTELSSQAVSTSSNDLTVIIEVSGVGQYSVVVDKNRTDQLPLKLIIDKAQHQLKLNPQTVFLIGGAKDVPYDEIIKTLNLLHSAGVKSVGLITHPI